MRTTMPVCLLMIWLTATTASAADIQGKWGLGAGVFAGGAQVSLIRGKSERSAWLFDVALTQLGNSVKRESVFNPGNFTSTSTQDVDRWTVRVGPGYRRFLRPDARFSPYWDIEVNGLYTRLHSNGSQGPNFTRTTQTRAGVGGQFAFGLEYFCRQHLSVAAHGTVADVQWQHTSRGLSTPGPHFSATGHVLTSSIRFSPVIFVRGYW